MKEIAEFHFTLLHSSFSQFIRSWHLNHLMPILPFLPTLYKLWKTRLESLSFKQWELAVTLQNDALTDAVIARLASKLSSRALEHIAVQRLGFTEDEVTNLRSECHEDSNRFNRKILIRWRNTSQRNTAQVDAKDSRITWKNRGILSVGKRGDPENTSVVLYWFKYCHAQKFDNKKMNFSSGHYALVYFVISGVPIHLCLIAKWLLCSYWPRVTQV